MFLVKTVEKKLNFFLMFLFMDKSMIYKLLSFFLQVISCVFFFLL